MLYSGALHAVGKTIRQHALVDEAREGGEHAARHLGAAGGEGEPGERDHRVASPVREPRIARDDRESVRHLRERALYHELARRDHQLPHPGGRARGLGLPLLPARQYLRRVPRSVRIRRFAIERRLSLGGQDDGERFSLPKRGVEGARMEVVVAVVEPALRLAQEIEAPVPVVGGLRGGRRGEDPEGPCAIESRHHEPMGRRLHAHAPSVGPGGRVVVAVVDEGLDDEAGGLEGPEHPVPDIRGVRPLLHPHALLDERVGAGIGPDRHARVETKALDEAVALGCDGPTLPAVGAELPGGAAVAHHFLELGGDQGAAERWSKGSHEETVVAAGERAGNRAGGEAADPVGAQPFARFGGVEFAGDVPAQLQQLQLLSTSRCRARSPWWPPSRAAPAGP